MVTRSIPLALACALLLGAGCSQPGRSATAGGSPAPRPSSLADRAQASARPTSQPVKTLPQHTPSATPRAAQSPSLSAAYASSLQIDAQHLLAADGLRVTNCGTRSTAGCRPALQQITTSANALQKDLDANPAPPCMKNADTTLRSAVALYLRGAQLGTQGIDQGSATEQAQARGILDQGATQFRAASTQLGQSACSVPPPAVAP